MTKLLIWMTCAAALVCASCTLTRKQADVIKQEAGDVASFFGLPRPLAEGLAGVAIAAVAHVNGHRRGRNKERAASIAADAAQLNAALADAPKPIAMPPPAAP